MYKRNILVTGGNRGIGLAIVQELAKNSDDQILLGCRNLEEGKKLAEELPENVHAVQLDLSKRDDLSMSINSILECFKKASLMKKFKKAY